MLAADPVPDCEAVKVVDGLGVTALEGEFEADAPNDSVLVDVAVNVGVLLEVIDDVDD